MCFYDMSSTQHLQPIRYTLCWTSQLHCVAAHWSPQVTKPPIRGQSGSVDPGIVTHWFLFFFSLPKLRSLFYRSKHFTPGNNFSFTQVCYKLEAMPVNGQQAGPCSSMCTWSKAASNRLATPSNCSPCDQRESDTTPLPPPHTPRRSSGPKREPCLTFS